MISNKKLIQEAIDKITENVIKEFFVNEKGKSSKKDNDDKEQEKSKREQEKTTKLTKSATRRARVINWLKDDTVNCAEIMRKLWKPESKKEDSARSYFYKCRDGELNDSGVPYSFSDKDINKLYAIMNNLK